MHPHRHMGDCGLPTDPVLHLAIGCHCNGQLSVVYMCIDSFTCLLAHLFVCLPVCLSVCLSVCLVCLSVCLSDGKKVEEQPRLVAGLFSSVTRASAYKADGHGFESHRSPLFHSITQMIQQ